MGDFTGFSWRGHVQGNPSRRVRDMRRLSYFLLAAVCTLLLSFYSSGAGAQTETGQITGVVTDPQGATVANAKIQVRNVATGAVRDLESDENGFYVVSNLLPAVYEISVEATGFAKLVRRVEVPVSPSAPK